MINLPNGCYCSDLKVFPAAWNRVNASVKKDWYIYYRFYDPLFKERWPKGYLKLLKGMNDFKTVAERQTVTKEILDDHLAWMREGFNPITRIVTAPVQDEVDYIISPETPFLNALEQAKDRLKYTGQRKADMKSVLKYFSQATKQLRFDGRAIKDVKRRHIMMIFERVEKNRPDTFSNRTYNIYRHNIREIYQELVRVEAIESNIITDIEKRDYEPARKELLTTEERKLIDIELRKSNYRFWRFIHIFFHSGARTPEMMQLKYEDVNLEKQTVAYTINKGKQRRVERPIKNSILHLWNEIMIDAKPGQYLFSKDLLPGTVSIRSDQMKRRWRAWVQIRLGIKKTWYSLKHLNSDEMSAAYGTAVAAALNAHDEKMTIKHYAVHEVERANERMNEIIKKADNTFAPVQ